jgi:alpha-beta hydrolase superfamily lysophospholipase
MIRPWKRWLGRDTARAETIFVTTPDDVRLAIHRVRPAPDRSSKAPAVMLLHGLGSNRFAFHFPGRSMAEWLAARGFDCYVPELRGSGLSGRRGSRWDLDDHLQGDLPPVLEAIREISGRDRVHWVGHSMGGILMMCFALVHGEEAIASGCALGSSMDYTAGDSGFKRLNALRPLISRLPSVPFGEASHLLAPLLGRVDTPLERFHFNRANVEPEIIRAVHANLFGPIPARLLTSLATTFEPGGMRNRDGTLRYLERLGELQLPLLLIAGSVDRQCPLDAVDATLRALRREGEIVVHRFGKAFGHREDYGHLDLILGRNAPEEVWPRVERWLSEGAGS